MKQELEQLFHALVNLGERQLSSETEAAILIKNFLQVQGIQFVTETYSTEIPRYKEWYLKIDGVNIACLPCGFHSGRITSKSTILASTISSQKNLYDANINFNPYSSVISRSNFYFAPALAIAAHDVAKVVVGTEIDGYLDVERTAHISENILIGNRTNPRNIIFTHYDSVGPGAIDNASGTTLAIDLFLTHPSLLEEHLFVIAGNEELSYDETIYWGHGYRDFEVKHRDVLQSTQHIIILDSLGHTSPLEITDLRTMTLAFPIENITTLAHKTIVVAGDLGKLMDFYHAENDVFENLNHALYQETFTTAYRLIMR